MNEQDMCAAKAFRKWIEQYLTRDGEWDTPLEADRVIATAIAQARVKAERERDEALRHCLPDALLEMIKTDRDALAAHNETLTAELLYWVRTFEEHGEPVRCRNCGRDWPQHVERCRVGRALATPAASLIAHDNALIERCAVECEERAVLNAAVEGPHDEKVAAAHRAIEAYECAFALRALKTDSEGEK